MPTWGWFLTAVAGAVVVWAVPRFLTFTRDAYVDKAVDRLEERLQPLWVTDMTEALDPIHSQLAAIKAEVTVNGGGSLKDRVLDMHRQLETLITDR